MPRMHELVETREMTRFLIGHVTDLVAGAAAPHDRELSLINPHRAVLTGLVDANHALDLVRRQRIAGQIGRPLRCHAAAPGISPAGRRHTMPRAYSHATTQQPSMITDASRLKPASDTPNRVQAGRSHSTGAVPRICCFICSKVIAPPAAAVQAVGPANQFCSTPTW